MCRKPEKRKKLARWKRATTRGGTLETCRHNWMEQTPSFRVLVVPDQIVVAFVAELRLYEYWVGERVIPEFLCLLEKHRVTGRTVWPCVQMYILIAFPEA